MRYIIAYGSLRKGGDWFRALTIKGVAEDIKLIKCINIQGFELYNLLDPETNEIKEDPIAAVLHNSKDSEITVDIIQVSDYFYEEIIKVISHTDFKPYTISVNNIIGEIFLYEGEVKKSLKIDSGNFFTRNLRKLKLAVG